MKHRTLRTLLAALCWAVLPAAQGASVVTPELAQQLATAPPGQTLPVIIQLANRVDLRNLPAAKHSQRDNGVLQSLKSRATQTQGPLLAAIAGEGTTHARQLWIVNAVAADLRPAAINRLALLPGIGRIGLDATVSQPSSPTASGGAAQWNLSAVHAPDLWAQGLTGAGVVVASLDTGVDPDHPDITGKWRGGSNSWFDPHGQHATPYDASGHGTQTMGLMVGGSAGGSAIGIAPDARWIAAKIFNDAGQATLSDIHLAFQWLLDPDGDATTVDTPDVVDASWGLLGAAPGTCNLEFNDDIRALKTAGIAVVFSAGNDGPAVATSGSPANNPDAYSVGATDNQNVIAGTSSRGPSGCDASIFPRLVAPGVNVLTADLSFGGLPVYATVSGTSFAAPHVAGLMALLGGGFPAATVSDLETALIQSAQDLGDAGADNSYGYGLANGIAAFDLLAANGASPPVITSTPPLTARQDQAYAYQVAATDANGDPLTYSLDVAPAGMSIAATGLIAWTPTAAQVGSNAVKVRVTDPTALTAFQSYTITVAAANRAPVAANDSYSVNQGATLNVAAAGVLANDSDPDGNAITAQLRSQPAHGSLTLSANGAFAYTPVAGYAGADSFTYVASDGSLSSAVATVAITVIAANKPPVAVNDSYSVPQWRSGSYTPQVLAVLANDSDPDGTLNPASVTIVSSPNRGGSVTVLANGTVSYKPKQRYTGSETFRYTVKDNSGATSNVATVTVTVR
jgi:VCBS repeat-containing protein